MKKILTLAVFAALAASLITGCSTKPDNMTEEIYDYGMEVVALCDAYDAGEIDADELEEGAYRYYQLMEAVPTSDDTVTSAWDNIVSGAALNIAVNPTDTSLHDSLRENLGC